MEPPPPDAGTRPPLSEREFHEIYARVPRLTVEVVVRGPDGILLTERRTGPCAGLWHIPGGTVRFGEPLVAAVRRVAADELGVVPRVGPFLGYLEYPSHYLHGLDSPVGLAFLCELDQGHRHDAVLPGAWCTGPPGPMHEEQFDFLRAHGLLGPPPEDPPGPGD